MPSARRRVYPDELGPDGSAGLAFELAPQVPGWFRHGIRWRWWRRRPSARWGRTISSSRRPAGGQGRSGGAGDDVDKVPAADLTRPGPLRPAAQADGHTGSLRLDLAALPAGPDLDAFKGFAAAIQPAVAKAARHRSAEMPAGGTGSRGTVADPAAGRLGLEGFTMRTAPHRHAAMVAANPARVRTSGHPPARLTS